MMDETQQQSIVTRLNRVEGQIRGIRRMVQEPRLCVELLQQLSAAEAALNRISLAVFRFHIERCVPDGITLGEPEKTRRLAELVDIFDRFARSNRSAATDVVVASVCLAIHWNAGVLVKTPVFCMGSAGGTRAGVKETL
jgi:DNA-binding FrmR family transcriptional regulator